MRQHPVHDAVAALTRRQKTTIHITPHVSYRATAPCLLAQLRAELGASTTGTGGRTIPTSRPPIATDVLDLWTEITWTVHSWAHHLNLDRRPYLADDDGHPIPAVGRLLRHVAATATGRGLDDIADAIHHAALRWRSQIEAMLHGRVEQRGVRGAQCPDCEATHVTDDRPGDGRVLIPAVVLVDRDLGGNRLQWLACLACGWSRGLADLADLATAGAAP